MSMITRLWKRRVSPKARLRSETPRLEVLESRTLLSVYTVTRTTGDKFTPGSLPWAVDRANYGTTGLDYVGFNVPGTGVRPITISEPLYLNDQVVIDGKSQPGYAGRPLIYVQGGSNTPSLFHLVNKPGSTSTGSTIQGLGMFEYTSNAVTINDTSTSNWIQDNYIGFFHDGTRGPWLTTGRFNPVNNIFPVGVGIQSSFNVVRANTISGLYNGVAIIGGETSSYASNSIQGNFIGTDPTGSVSTNYGNLSDGIFLGAGAKQNFLGPDNVISGNASAGVELLHPTNTGNVIFRNKLGTDRLGEVAIGNGELGVLIANGASGNTVGGPFGGNIISGNGLGGVSLGTDGFRGASGNWVQNNIIGLNSRQTQIIGTQNVGIGIGFGASRNLIQANVVAGHVEHGFLMADTESNYILENWIGQSADGTWFPNRENGFALLAGASYNFILRNSLGANLRGPYYADRGAVSNYIG